MRAAVIQISSQTDKARNVETATALIRDAAASGAELTVLPEYWTYQGPDDGYLEAAEPIPGPTSEAMADLARELGIVVHAGSMPERTPGNPRAYNTSVVFGRDGQEIARYRKIHLFDVDLRGEVTESESHTIAPGNDVVTASLDRWTLGLSICYDLRFPELYRELSERGADIIAIPSAFTMFTGKDHWQVLVRARAIENLSYVLAAGQYGRYDGGTNFGRSLIVDPWGIILATVPDGEGFAIAELEQARVQKIRSQLPALQNRRLGRAAVPA
jgi:predicted amidohydrolase